MGAVAPEESDEEEFEVNEPDFKSHVLENVRVSKEERKKKGKARGKVETAPEPVEAKDAAPPRKADKVKKPSKIYIEAMAELEAEKKARKAKATTTEKKPKGKKEKKAKR